MKKVFRIVLIGVCLITLLPLFGQELLGPKTFRVIELTDTDIIFELKPFDLDLTTVSINNRSYQTITISGFGLSSEPGYPMLPITGTLIQIPHGSQVSVRVLDSTYEDLPDIHIPPAPTINEDLTNSKVTYSYQEDPFIYDKDQFWPIKLVDFSEKGRWRNREIGRIQIYPVQYNPMLKMLRVYKSMKIKVSFSKPFPSGVPPKRSPEDAFDRLFQQVILNANQARVLDQRFKSKSVEEDWYNPNATYYKLFVDEEGIYALTYDDLIAAGVEVELLDLHSLKILHQGKQVPIWISGPQGSTFSSQNVIYFYGDRNRGKDTYYDMYTDTNIYWLTTEGGPGKHYRLISENGNSGVLSSFYWETLHFEKDSLFYRWNIASTLDEGEGWVWRFLFPNESAIFDFNLSGINHEITFCTLKVRVHGTTIDPINPDHHIKVFLNNQLVGEEFFDGREELILKISVPVVLLKEGSNRFQLHLVPDTGAEVNQIYLDWVEIIYPRVLAAQEDQIKYQLGEFDAEQVTKVLLSNFKSDSIFVFDPIKGKFWKPSAQKLSIYKVESAGFDDGSFVRFQIDFENYFFKGLTYRGYNLAVIDSQTGQPQFHVFDTFGSKEQVEAMVTFIESLPESTLVLIGISDEGSVNMTENAFRALESLGSALIRSIKFRDSWALIGWKGAPKGSVKEVLIRRAEGTAIISDTLTANWAFRYAISLKDTVDEGSFYFAITQNALKKVVKIEKETNSDLRNPSNGADYIVITHNNFIQQAQKLARYRRDHDGFRIMVIDVQDIYDEFNSGIMHPQAIKDFLTFAYQNWQLPAPAYVVLLGDASWDPKFLMKESRKRNYVPTYGDPVSDHWYVTLDGPKDVLPEMFIGRIPIESPEQAEILIQKIIDYENLPFAAWNKKFVFFNGGIDSIEQAIFRHQAGVLISDHIATDPLYGKAIQFNKTTNEAITVAFRNIGAEAIRKGTVWVNFIGHSGSAVWDINIGQPEDWQNNDVFPFITGMSCHSARFANPILNSLAEEYVLNPIGAIAYWGSTGFGYITQDFILLNGLYPSITKNLVRRIGEATTLAKANLWSQIGSSRSNNVIHQYTIIGDPAVNLKMAKEPELAVMPNEIITGSDFLLISDSTAIVSAKIRNFGLITPDSVVVQFKAIDVENNEIFISAKKIKPVAFVDSITVNWDLPGQPGTYRLQVIVDPDDIITEEDEDNNVAEIFIDIYASTLNLIKPISFAVLQDSTPELVTNNSRLFESDLIYFFEVDTSVNFNSPLLIKSPPIREGLLVTNWQPKLSTASIYYWRVRTFDGESYSPWERSSFLLKFNTDFVWQQSNALQLSQNILVNTSTEKDNIRLNLLQFVYRAESAGFLDGNSSVLSVNKKIFGKNSRGYNIAVFNDSDGSLIANDSFDLYAFPERVNAMTAFLNGLDPDVVVLAAIRDEGSRSMNEGAYQAFEDIGSALIRQVGFRDSWAIIGRKGAPRGSVPEALSKAGTGTAVVADTLYRFVPSGQIITPEIGPALAWQGFFASYHDQQPDTKITFKILGFNNKESRWDTLLTALAVTDGIDLSEINAKIYPKIKLMAELFTDNGLMTPVLNNWALNFSPPPDLVIGKRSITTSQDTVFSGQEIQVNALIGNFGLNAADSFYVSFQRSDPEKGRVEFSRLLVPSLEIDQYKKISVSLNTAGLQGPIKITVVVDKENVVPEINETNNSYFTSIWVAQDTLVPEIQVTFDGRVISEGDFVTARPEIIAEITDQGSVSLVDTSMVTIWLDEQRVTFGNAPDQAQFIVTETSGTSNLKILTKYQPQLSDGEHNLRILARDAANNVRVYENRFFVRSEFLIANVMNYPNPFSHDTEFTYVLTQPADDVIIKIYTISGKLIQTLEFAPTNVGFNQIHWDGRDADGDALSNGVYLYKIIARKDDQQVEVVEKFVVVR